MSSQPHHSVFGGDRFGVLAERFARFFGTPRFILAQSGLVIIWIVLNAAFAALRFDAYPFILLNLAFSTQAAYAAPLILLAQTRQADRDKLRDEALEAHRAEMDRREAEFEQHQAETLADDKALAQQHVQLLEQNTELTQQVARLAQELHDVICAER